MCRVVLPSCLEDDPDSCRGDQRTVDRQKDLAELTR